MVCHLQANSKIYFKNISLVKKPISKLFRTYRCVSLNEQANETSNGIVRHTRNRRMFSILWNEKKKLTSLTAVSTTTKIFEVKTYCHERRDPYHRRNCTFSRVYLNVPELSNGKIRSWFQCHKHLEWRTVLERFFLEENNQNSSKMSNGA